MEQGVHAEYAYRHRLSSNLVKRLRRFQSRRATLCYANGILFQLENIRDRTAKVNPFASQTSLRHMC